MFKRRLLLAATALVGLGLIHATGVKASSPNPYLKADQSDITITGDIAAVYDESFALNYGTGLITVEMDDWDFYDEASRLVPGDTVTVRGEVDADFYQVRTIEADSVYSYDRSTYYYANDADEEAIEYWGYNYTAPVPEGTWFSLTGFVQDISGSEFTLNTPSGNYRVETASLSYNPLDDVGYQKIREGDRVYVSGLFDDSFFDGREIKATSIVTLSKDRRKKTKGKGPAY